MGLSSSLNRQSPGGLAATSAHVGGSGGGGGVEVLEGRERGSVSTLLSQLFTAAAPERSHTLPNVLRSLNVLYFSNTSLIKPIF